VVAQLSVDLLPLGVLIPTRNSMHLLEDHLTALRPWLHRVQEVVVIDSQSSDGTPEYLHKNLDGPSVRCLSHPPGLYESWNYGLRHIRAPWTYIATVGDNMPEATITTLLAVGQENHSDLVISPPTLVSANGKQLNKQWPLHKYIEWKGTSSPGQINGLELFLWNVLSVPGSLLGSSASNIYRTEYMQAHPFPAGYRHACDTAWAIRNSFEARWAIAPGLHSEFLVHPAAPRTPEPVRRLNHERLHELARDVFGAVLDDCCPEKRRYAELLKRYWDESLKALQAGRTYTGMRDQGFPWFLRPATWRERSRRNQYIANAGQIRARILELLSDSTGSQDHR